MPAEISLDRLQRWMQAVVVHPGSVDEAVAAAATQAELPAARIGEVVLPSKSLTPTERVDIYHGMYLLRMEEALADDYPGLKHFLGERRFFALVRSYVQVHPSRSYTLNPLGKHLPDFVLSATGMRRREFCFDLARLELAVTEVFDAAETRSLSESDIAAVAPEAWERAVLQPIAALRLLELRYNVSAYAQSVKNGDHEHPRPRLRKNWLGLFRREYSLYRLELSAAAHGLLTDLTSGKPLGEAVGAAVARGRRGKPSADDLYRWFRQWVSAGVFREVVLDRLP